MSRTYLKVLELLLHSSWGLQQRLVVGQGASRVEVLAFLGGRLLERPLHLITTEMAWRLTEARDFAV